tara:strand:+ start:69 stop:605 length:537 start_codon:yes stop_codon:yes gene_type:complete
MRFISGLYRGRKINLPKNLNVRPTTDLSKESLFNILNNTFEFSNISFLDLFSGSGSISFEFASRGCKKITSIDINHNAIKFIKSISNQLELGINCIKSDTIRFINNSEQNFDIIFADPPYNYNINMYEELIVNLFENNMLKNNGMIVIEHSKKNTLVSIINYKETREYGGCCFSFFYL